MTKRGGIVTLFNKKKRLRRINWQGLLMASCGIVFLIIFAYSPMYGILMAFKKMDYSLNIMKDLQSAKWVYFDNFIKFFNDPQFSDVMVNTICYNILSIIFCFPIPIVFALLLNEIRNRKYLRVVQTVTSFPNFVSWAIYGGLVISFVSADGGIFNDIMVTLGIQDKPINYMTQPQFFWQVIMVSSTIKGTGYGSIIYLAAIAGVDPQLYESAIIDGGNRMQMAWYITIPSIMGTIIIMLLMRISNILGSSFDVFWMLQNSLNLERSEVLSTFIYKVGLTQRRYSYTTAVGLFQSFVGVMLLLPANFLAKKLTGRGLY